MDQDQQMEILRGVLAVAVSDGKIARSEKGVYESLARKAGISNAWLEEMIESARRGESVKSSMFHRTLEDPVRAMTLLVATAAIDGEITEEERSVLVDISLKLRLPPGTFGQVFQKGLESAEKLRNK